MIQWLLRVACPAPVATPEPTPEDVAVRSSAWLPAIAGMLSGMGGPAAAVTLGKTIVVHPSASVSSRLIKHELEHVKQWREHGWTFPMRYVANHLRHGYTNNPYEIEARNAESK